MAASKRLALSLASLLASLAAAQQVGQLTPEVHPLLPTWECTLRGGCVQKNTSVVLDADYRWTHAVNGTDNCKPAGLNATLCPDVPTCAANCALEGVDYASYGVSTNGSALTLTLFVNKTTGPSMSSPRVYLLANDTTYDLLSLVGRELAFDVDVSQLPCGTNGALYLSEMRADGGRSELNPAGAQYGTGYCDAQCPSPAFINGEANLHGSGACCNEMDIWEANSRATALTPHPCNVTGVFRCDGALCGNADRYSGVCDKDGCDLNPYRLGAHSFYGPNATVDTTRPFTVVTQFVAAINSSNSSSTPRWSNGTAAAGELVEIRRLYVQDGRVLSNAAIQVPGITAAASNSSSSSSASITDAFCSREKAVFGGGPDAFSAQGGLRAMGEALARGMVLAFSVWDDAGSAMKWLDATYPDGSDPATQPGTGRGPCGPDEGKAETMATTAPWTQVTFSNIKVGEIGSTYKS